MRNIKHILLLLIFAASSAMSQQPSAIRVKISPDNRAMIFFDKLPAKYESSLDKDRKKVMLNIPGAEVSEDARHVSHSGIINDVYINNSENGIKVSLILKEKKGYSAVPMPWSRAILVEVFDWNKLSEAEDDYRQGLFAIEFDIPEGVKKHLGQATRKAVSNASAMYGIYSARKGNYRLAADYLSYAIKSESNIPDCFGALWEIATKFGRNDKAEIFKNAFLAISPIDTLIPVGLPEPIDDQSLSDHVNMVFDDPLLDSNFVFSSIAPKDTSANDSLNSRFSGLFEHETDTLSEASAENYNADSPSMIPSWISKALIYSGVIFLIVIVLIIFAYLSWRKAQIKRKSDTFIEEMENESKPEPEEKKNRPGSILNKTDNQAKITPPKKKKESTEDPKEKIFNLLRKLEEDKTKREKQDKSKQTPDLKDTKKPKQHRSPRIQAAIQLREEQEKIKNKIQSSLEEGQLPQDIAKFADVARRLGIDPENITGTPKKQDISDDQGIISKLSDKFGVKNKKE